MAGDNRPKVIGRAAQRAGYRLVADDLRDRIRRGQVTEGARLPTEAELVESYKVSRQTVRRAYLELVSEGLVERIPGRGSFPVRRAAYRRTFESVDELLALSLDTVMEVITPLELIADPDAAAALGLQFDDVLHIGYRRLHEDAPFCFTHVHLPPRLAAVLEPARFLRRPLARSRETVLGILDRSLPHPIAGSRQTITAVGVPEELAGWIDCTPAEPVLRIERVHFDADGRPVERCVNYFNPGRYVYRLQLQRHSGGGHGG